MQIDLGTLRKLFRNLQAFESLYEADGTDTITTPDGQQWTVWDLQYLYRARKLLSPRQAQAIELCLYENIKEKDAALLMGIQESSPVAIYANNGLRRIIAMVAEGRLRKFRPVEMAS